MEKTVHRVETHRLSGKEKVPDAGVSIESDGDKFSGT